MTGFSPSQVRRASQNFVVSLLEDERGNKGKVEEGFCTQNLSLLLEGFITRVCVCVCVCVGNLLSQLCPMIKRCLGKDENYDLRMDTVLVS